MSILSRRGPEGMASGPRPVGHPSSWRSVTLQLVVLAALAGAQYSVLADARADVRADRGIGPQVSVGAVERGASPPVTLAIPKLGMDTRLIGLRKNRSGQLQVPEDPQRAGWYSQGFAPGDDGPAVLVGHVDSYRGPGVFARLHEMVPGDPVTVRRSDGTLAQWVVERVETYAKREFPTEDVYVGDGSPQLVLVTCGGEFDARAKSYLSNVVVFASPASPEAPAAEAPAPEAPAPEAPAVEAPAVEAPAVAPAAPAPAAPARKAPAPESPAPESPAPASPAPESPAPASPAPESPAPASPAPESPAPESPAPESPAPSRLLPGRSA